MKHVALSTLLGLSLLHVAACGRREEGPTGECNADSDCPSDEPVCFQNTCVECAAPEHCNCHEVCYEQSCQPLGATVQITDDPTRVWLNAHGTWSGTPGTASYSYRGRCVDDESCEVGHICNPFTSGCIQASQFLRRCSDGCDTPGPHGELLVCDTQHDRCVPAGLCQDTVNCCGVQDFVCDNSIDVCVPKGTECKPPDQPTSTCPLLPRATTECNALRPGTFCSLVGECVQCVCDADCGAGLKCYQALKECKPLDYCQGAEECGNNLSCDTRTESCQPRCDPNNAGLVCETDEYCEPDDLVCRPLTDLPCQSDSYEPNDSLQEAVDRSVTLGMPTFGTPVTYDDFSLCTEGTGINSVRDQDWFQLELDRGDRVVFQGSTPTGTRATMRIIGPDKSTELDTGQITEGTGDLAEVTANLTGTHYLGVEQNTANQDGFYRLVVSRSAGTPCADAFETDNGSDDLPADAFTLYDAAAPGAPSACAFDSAGNVDTVACTAGALKMCTGDVDYYVVGIEAGSDLEVKLSQFSGNLDMSIFGPFASANDVATAPLVAATTNSLQLTEILRTVGRQAGFYLVRVERRSGGATPYDLEVTVTSSATACIEDTFDDTTAATGYTNPTTELGDPAGINDSFANRSVVGLLPNQAIAIRAGAGAGAGLSLCRGDVEWFELAHHNGTAFEPLPANHKIQVNVALDAGSPAGVFTVAGGTSETLLSFGSNSTTTPATSFFIDQTSGSSNYFVKIFGATANTQPLRYTLTVELIAPPACGLDDLGDDGTAGENDAPASAFDLVAPTWPDAINESAELVGGVGGDLSLCIADDDWYEITVPAGAQVQAWVKHDPTVANIGIYLYDDSIAGLSTPTAGTPPTTGLIALSNDPGFAYHRVLGEVGGTKAYVLVSNDSTWPLLDYTLGVRLLPLACIDTYEGTGNNTFSTATAMPMQGTSDPQVDYGFLDPLAVCSLSDDDWYKVFLSPGDGITFNAFFDANNISELDIYLYPPAGPGGVAGSLVYDWGFDGLATVDYTLDLTDPAGQYLLEVTPFSTASGYYYLEAIVHRACVDDGSEPTSPNEVATLGALPMALADRVLCNDHDWYRFDVGGSTTVTVCAQFTHSAGDIDLTVWDDADVTAANDPTPDDGDAAAFSWTKQNVERLVINSASGEYYLKAFLDARDQVNQTYDLWILSGNVTCPPVCPGGGTCSGNGECGLGTCTCDPGFYGADCASACPGAGTCSTHGTCDDGAAGTGVCTCDAGYFGADCSTQCPGGGDCSDNGTCDDGATGTGECTCDAGYFGLDCATQCPGGGDCSSNGTCDDGAAGTGECTCDAGYYGVDCASQCPGGGNCSSFGTCDDGAGGTGLCTCDTTLCTAGQTCDSTPACVP